MKTLRFNLDKIIRGGIKLLMLTGVAFTVTACYGVMPPPELLDNEEYQADTQKVEQQLMVEEVVE